MFAVVGIAWSVKRRPKTRLNFAGEDAVEPALRKVLPVVYGFFWVALVASLLASQFAKSIAHSAVSIDDLVRFRTYLALSAAARTAMWACWIPFVIRATQVQKQREAASLAVRRSPRE